MFEHTCTHPSCSSTHRPFMFKHTHTLRRIKHTHTLAAVHAHTLPFKLQHTHPVMFRACLSPFIIVCISRTPFMFVAHLFYPLSVQALCLPFIILSQSLSYPGHASSTLPDAHVKVPAHTLPSCSSTVWHPSLFQHTHSLHVRGGWSTPFMLLSFTLSLHMSSTHTHPFSVGLVLGFTQPCWLVALKQHTAPWDVLRSHWSWHSFNCLPYATLSPWVPCWRSCRHSWFCLCWAHTHPSCSARLGYSPSPSCSSTHTHPSCSKSTQHTLHPFRDTHTLDVQGCPTQATLPRVQIHTLAPVMFKSGLVHTLHVQAHTHPSAVRAHTP